MNIAFHRRRHTNFKQIHHQCPHYPREKVPRHSPSSSISQHLNFRCTCALDAFMTAHVHHKTLRSLISQSKSKTCMKIYLSQLIRIKQASFWFPPSFFTPTAFLSVTFNKLNQVHLLKMHKNLRAATLIYFLTKEGVKVCRMKFRVVSYIDWLLCGTNIWSPPSSNINIKYNEPLSPIFLLPHFHILESYGY